MSGRPLVGNDWSVLNGTWPDDPPRVSVVVAHYEQADDLRRTLTALRSQTYPRELVEIVVVDDGSATAPEVPDDVVLVRQADEGFRLAAARNRGAEAASGDILCFLDADCAPEPGYLAELTRLPALSSDVVTVGRRRHADLSALPPDAPLDRLPDEVLFDDPSWLANAYERSGNLFHADARSYRYLIGATLCCSADFFRETGGFDESFTEYGGEDWDWAWRCWMHGALFAHVPTAIAWHNGPDAGGRERDPAAVNAETRRMERYIPIAGSRPHALLIGADGDVGAGATDGAGAGTGAVGDVAVRLSVALTSTQAIITADSILRHLPTARVFVGDSRAFDGMADPRIVAGEPPADVPYRIDVLAPVRIETDAPVRSLLEGVGVGADGSVRIADVDGPLLDLTSARVLARTRRWGDTSFTARTLAATGVARRLRSPEPSLAAYYGDWD
ncbi:glycosyltransferase family 2 protein [Labedella endophytica]|uniref:glycosyltransferase family 2 protein n=1 Tax=Labedella endophytica TaxID=1523160 RepID=UPI00140776F5|nr:glycosyltransferase [Labedella endophytica]